MIRFFDYFSDTFRYALVDFEYHMQPGRPIDRVYYTDRIEVQKAESGLDMTYTRVVAFEPEDAPIVQAVYSVLFDYNDKLDVQRLTEDEILSGFYDNALDALDQVAARASLLIAQVTFGGVSEPMVLPPKVAKREQKTD